MRVIAIVVVLLFISSGLLAQRGPAATSQIRSVAQGSLVAADSQPFHLEASITEGRQATPYATVEMDWISAAVMLSDLVVEVRRRCGTKSFPGDRFGMAD